MTFKYACSVIILLLVYGVYSTGYRPIPDEQYDVILKLLLQEFNVPVKERSAVQNSAIVKFWRNKYTLAEDRKTILLDGKPVVRASQVSKIVKKEIHKTKGAGTRKLHRRLANKVIGLSEKRVQNETEKNAIYSQLNVKFSNKDTLKQIYAKKIHDIHQIDLIDLSNLHAYVEGKSYRYALSIIDVFSRYLWLAPLEKKSSKAVASGLKSIYRVHGTPKILQSDNGKEFQGAVQKLMRLMGVKIVRSSPYHPQSQGKVERSHRTLRKKIKYDLLKKCRSGMNWVVELPVYNQVMNEEPKAELAWRSPFEVYFGRKSNCVLMSGDCSYIPDFIPSEQLRRPTPGHYTEFLRSRSATRTAAREATKRMNRITTAISKNTHKSSVYRVNEKVLVRMTKSKKARLGTARIIPAYIEKANFRNNRYRVKITNQDGKIEIKWVSVSDITSYTLNEERRKKKQDKIKRSKYLIAFSHEDRLSDINSQGFDIVYDPVGDGNCQFSAVADQLTSVGIHRSPDTLREEVVSDMRVQPYTCNGTDISMFVDNNNLQGYLSSTESRNTYGDHLTLLRISEIFHCRILVISSRGPDHMRVVGTSGPLLVVGHLPEGHGEHYLSLRPRVSVDIDNILDNIENLDRRAENVGREETANEPDQRDGDSGCEDKELKQNEEEIEFGRIIMSEGESYEGGVEKEVYDSAGELADERDGMSRLHSEEGLLDKRNIFDEREKEQGNEKEGVLVGEMLRKRGVEQKELGERKEEFSCGRDRVLGDEEEGETGFEREEQQSENGEHGVHVESRRVEQFDQSGESSINIRREPEHDPSFQMKSILDLPVEILTEIVKNVLDDDLDMITTLAAVHTVFDDLCSQYVHRYQDRVRRHNRRIYLAPHLLNAFRLENHESFVISVQRLSRQSGRLSGLMQSVRNHLQEYRMWWTAWLVLVPISHGWFRIDNVFWRR